MTNKPPLWLIAALVVAELTVPLIPDGPLTLAALAVFWPLAYWLTKKYPLPKEDE